MKPTIYYTEEKITNNTITKVEILEGTKPTIIKGLNDIVEYLNKEKKPKLILTNVPYFINVYENIIYLD